MNFLNYLFCRYLTGGGRLSKALGMSILNTLTLRFLNKYFNIYCYRIKGLQFVFV